MTDLEISTLLTSWLTLWRTAKIPKERRTQVHAAWAVALRDVSYRETLDAIHWFAMYSEPRAHPPGVDAIADHARLNRMVGSPASVDDAGAVTLLDLERRRLAGEILLSLPEGEPITWALNCQLVCGVDKLVLVSIAANVGAGDWGHDRSRMKLDELAACASTSERAVLRSIAVLVKAGLISLNKKQPQHYPIFTLEMTVAP